MTRLDAFRRALSDTGADAALISSGINESYLSGFDFSDGYLMILRDTAYLVTDPRYSEAARAEATEGFTVTEATGGTLMCALDLAVRGGAKTVLIEENDISVHTLTRCRELADGKLGFTEGASDILSRTRRHKDAGEIEAIAAAQSITDAAFTHILGYLSPDVTERDVALELEYFMRRAGADGMAFSVIAVSGSASSLPHGVPRDKKLERGFLTMDFGAKKNGYCSDMTRTVVIGKADADMRRLYSTVLTAQTEALGFLRAGVSCREADAVARDIIEGAGYHGCFGHSLGHGVGRYIHESPRLSSSAGSDSLMPGDIVTVEPGIYLPGKYGCRIEDMVAVREDGILDFTASPKELIEI